MIHDMIINGSATAALAPEAPYTVQHEPATQRAPRYYEYRHIVGFEETNLVGNVYYVNHLRWQGRCREMFLYDNGVDVLKDFSEGFAMVTVRVSCDYLSELCAFDTLSIRMSLGELVQNRITLRFEYWKLHNAGHEELIARGEQQVACMRRQGERLVPAPVPERLREVLRRYAAPASDGRISGVHE
jgi:enediyne biosynthesis thioesterase